MVAPPMCIGRRSIRRNSVAAIGAWCLLAVTCGAAGDPKKLPPEVEEVFSPGREYVLVIRTLDHWRTRGCTAELNRVQAGGRNLLWRKTLPHSYRPRFALVDARGRTLLLDEWIQVFSPLAISLFDREGNTVAQHGFEKVAAVLGTPRDRIAHLAQHGAWMQSLPQLIPAADIVRVVSGDRMLTIRLCDGSLEVASVSR